MRVIQSFPEKGLDFWPLSQQNAALYKSDVKDFTHFAAYTPQGVTLTGDGAPERLLTAQVSGDFFATLGVPAALGRTVADSEVTRSSAPVAILGYGFWQSHFGGAASVIGKTIDLDGTPTRIVGVMPKGFSFPRPDIALYQPFAVDPTKRFGWYLVGIARLTPDVTVAHAEREATTSMWNWARTNSDVLWPKPLAPETTRMHAIVTPLQTALTGDVRRPLLVLQAAVALLLLIAIANIATLVSSRAAARTPEIAVRTALGASARRVARQLVTESLVVAAIGGASAWRWRASRCARSRHGATIPCRAFVKSEWIGAYSRSPSASPSRVASLRPRTGISHGTNAAVSRRSRRNAEGERARSDAALNNAMIVTQIALSLVLLVSAGLLIKSFRRLVETDLGFEPRGVLSMTVPLPMKKYMGSPGRGAGDGGDRRASATAAWRARRGRGDPAVQRGLNTDGFLVEGREPPPNAGRRDASRPGRGHAGVLRSARDPAALWP